MDWNPVEGCCPGAIHFMRGQRGVTTLEMKGPGLSGSAPLGLDEDAGGARIIPPLGCMSRYPARPLFASTPCFDSGALSVILTPYLKSAAAPVTLSARSSGAAGAFLLSYCPVGGGLPFPDKGLHQ